MDSIVSKPSTEHSARHIVSAQELVATFFLPVNSCVSPDSLSCDRDSSQIHLSQRGHALAYLIKQWMIRNQENRNCFEYLPQREFNLGNWLDRYYWREKGKKGALWEHSDGNCRK